MANIGTTAEIVQIIFHEQGDPAAPPPANYWYVYLKTDGVYMMDDAGNVTGPLAAAGAPGIHAPQHELLGADEIDVSGLSGVLADEQTPIDHDHSGDAGDGNQFDAANLTSGLAASGEVLTADGVSGAAWAPIPGTYMDDLLDVNAPDPHTGEVLVWDVGTSFWITQALPDPTIVRQFIFNYAGDLEVGSGAFRLYNHLGVTVQNTAIYIAVNTAPTGDDVIIDIHKNGVTIFTVQANRPVILDGANTGSTVTIDVPAWADGEYLTMDIDQVGSTTPGSNLTVTVVGEA